MEGRRLDASGSWLPMGLFERSRNASLQACKQVPPQVAKHVLERSGHFATNPQQRILMRAAH